MTTDTAVRIKEEWNPTNKCTALLQLLLRTLLGTLLLLAARTLDPTTFCVHSTN